jgi:hypothetical protein
MIKKIIGIINISIIVIFFASYKNITIDVVKAVQQVDNNKITRVVYTSDNKKFNVPYDRTLNFNLFRNLVLLNFDADDDWNKLKKPGKYHVRVYGYKTFFKDDDLNIISVIDSLNDQPLLVDLFNFVKIVTEKTVFEIVDQTKVDMNNALDENKKGISNAKKHIYEYNK